MFAYEISFTRVFVLSLSGTVILILSYLSF